MSSPEDEKRFPNWPVLILCWVVIIGCAVMFLWLCTQSARADTTKVGQAIEKPRTWGITVPAGAIIESTKVIYDSTGPGICITFPPIFMAVKIDGKWFPLKWLVDSLPPMYTDSVVRARGLAERQRDLVWDGRLDSVYTLPHDSIVWSLGPKYDERGNPNRVTLKIPGAWWYFNWSNGKRVNMRLSK